MITKSNFKSGDKHHKLTLTGKSYFDNGKLYVECICECGTILFKHFGKLKSGHSKLCGNSKCRISENIDEGQTYGLLTLTGNCERIGNNTLVEVICKCGTKTMKRINRLKDGSTKSCGSSSCRERLFDGIYMGYKGEVYFSFTLTGGSKIEKGIRKAETKCICGRIKYVDLCDLKKGEIKSCGCKKIEYLKEASKTHGFSDHPIYHSYCRMISRCFEVKDERFKDYGFRGIKVCDEWKNDFLSFYNWAINAGWGKGLEIDRINNDGNYEPLNCRWATSAVQNRNKRNNRNISAFGETKCITDWAKDDRCRVSKKTLLKRIRKGVLSEVALTINNYRK